MTYLKSLVVSIWFERIAVLVSIFLCLSPWIDTLSNLNVANDISVYCAASYAWETGGNPYLSSDTHVYHAFTYPPATLKVFSLLCAQSPWTFLLLYLSCLLAAFYIATRWLSLSLPACLVLLLFGFDAARWNFLSGNIGLLHLFFFTLAFWSLAAKKMRWMALSLGMAGAIKLVPLAYPLCWFGFCWLCEPRAHKSHRETLALIALSLLPAMALQVVSLLTFPSLYQTYQLSLFGEIPGQHSPIHEMKSGRTHPSLFLFLLEASKLLGAPESSAVFLLISMTLLGAFGIYRLRGRESTVQFAFLAIVVTLLLPRLKPYSFTFAILPCIFLFAQTRGRSYLATLLLCIPIAGPHISIPSLGFKSLELLNGFNQWISLFVTAVLAFWCLHLPPKRCDSPKELPRR